MVLDAALLNTQDYKVRIKSKVEQSRERGSALPYNWKRSLRVALDYGRQLYLILTNDIEKKEYTNMFQELEIYTYCSMNDILYMGGVHHRKKLIWGKVKQLHSFTAPWKGLRQRLSCPTKKAKENDKDVLGLSCYTLRSLLTNIPIVKSNDYLFNPYIHINTSNVLCVHVITYGMDYINLVTAYMYMLSFV